MSLFTLLQVGKEQQNNYRAFTILQILYKYGVQTVQAVTHSHTQIHTVKQHNCRGVNGIVAFSWIRLKITLQGKQQVFPFLCVQRLMQSKQRVQTLSKWICCK